MIRPKIQQNANLYSSIDRSLNISSDFFHVYWTRYFLRLLKRLETPIKTLWNFRLWHLE